MFATLIFPVPIVDTNALAKGFDLDGTSLLSQIFLWAQRTGATDASLQVQGDNLAARALYARVGFEELYEYWYRIRP